MKENITHTVDLFDFLEPENALEEKLLADPDFRDGLHWGVPRFGHPEGEIYKHVKEVLTNIDRLDPETTNRSRMRLIAFSHDTFKKVEDKSTPRNWDRHHGMLARKFLEPLTNDRELLDIVELHDEAYYCWCHTHLHKKPELGKQRLARLRQRLGHSFQMFYEFFVCDTLTGDKIPTPLYWLQEMVPGHQRIAFDRGGLIAGYSAAQQDN